MKQFLHFSITRTFLLAFLSVSIGAITAATAASQLTGSITKRRERRSSIPPAQEIRFSDELPDWAADAIRALTKAGVTKGYQDGRFGASDEVTRGQEITFLYRIFREAGLFPAVPGGCQQYFDDVPEQHYAYVPLCAFRQQGLLGGGLTFRPDSSATRGETAELMASAMANELEKGGVTADGLESTFSDVKATDPAADAIALMYASGLMKGNPSGMFDKNGKVNRAQAAVIMKRSLDALKEWNAGAASVPEEPLPQQEVVPPPVPMCDERTDYKRDARNCGFCGNACAFPNGSARCQDGFCRIRSCDADWEDRNSDPIDGCETPKGAPQTPIDETIPAVDVEPPVEDLFLPADVQPPPPPPAALANYVIDDLQINPHPILIGHPFSIVARVRNTGDDRPQNENAGRSILRLLIDLDNDGAGGAFDIVAYDIILPALRRNSSQTATWSTSNGLFTETLPTGLHLFQACANVDEPGMTFDEPNFDDNCTALLVTIEDPVAGGPAVPESEPVPVEPEQSTSSRGANTLSTRTPVPSLTIPSSILQGKSSAAATSRASSSANATARSSASASATMGGTASAKTMSASSKSISVIRSIPVLGTTSSKGSISSRAASSTARSSSSSTARSSAQSSAGTSKSIGSIPIFSPPPGCGTVVAC